ncbi:MAG: magnesium/cobalt transporter CorA [Rubrivivax sp.]|nr:magnesium/cobalt transporter CorA [Rubrivivax sp.]
MKHKPNARAAALSRQRFRVPAAPAGSAPGTLHPAQAKEGGTAAPAQLALIRYGGGAGISETAPASVHECAAPGADDGRVQWLHLQGAPTAEQLARLGQVFGLHPLALEAVASRQRRPKFESFVKQQFVLLGLVGRDEAGGVSVDQVSLFLTAGCVISINEGPQDLFEPVRRRIHSAGKFTERGADYLLYALIDVVIDSGFPLLEQLGDELEALEDEILADPSQQARNRLHYVKRELMVMRRAWWPQREVIANLMRQGEGFLAPGTLPYLRDCHEHCVVVIDFVETYREVAASLLDTYLSAISQRMNDIMKALTIIATIFLPLTFITGLYGMNFDTASPWNLPELHWRYGYFYALSVMLAVTLCMVFYFRRKRWL